MGKSVFRTQGFGFEEEGFTVQVLEALKFNICQFQGLDLFLVVGRD